MTIGNITFTMKKGKYTPQVGYWSITDAYNKPSLTKQVKWNNWVKWLEQNGEGDYDYIAIRSRNTYVFTINGRITLHGIEYSFLITPTRNELYFG